MTQPAEPFTAQFDEVSVGGRHRVTVAVEQCDREPDGSIPTAAWYRGEEFRLDVEGGAGVSIYVRRL